MQSVLSFSFFVAVFPRHIASLLRSILGNAHLLMLANGARRPVKAFGSKTMTLPAKNLVVYAPVTLARRRIGRYLSPHNIGISFDNLN
jgi:hypothetical protein